MTHALLYVLAAAVALVVFLIDAFTPLDIAIAVLYVVVVLLVALDEFAARCDSHVMGLRGAHGDRLCNVPRRALLGRPRCALSREPARDRDGRRCRALRNRKSTATLQEQLQLLDLTHDAIVVYDMNDLITFWNQGAEQLYGWTTQQAIGQPVHELTQTRSSVSLDEIRRELLRSGAGKAKCSMCAMTGTAVTVVISSRWALWRDAKRQAGAAPCSPPTTTLPSASRWKASCGRAMKDELRATIDAILVHGLESCRAMGGCLVFINRRWNELGVTCAWRTTAHIWRSIVHPDDCGAMQHAWHEAIATWARCSRACPASAHRLTASTGGCISAREPLRDSAGKIFKLVWREHRYRRTQTTGRRSARAQRGVSVLDAQRLSAHRQHRDEHAPAARMWWSDETYRIFDYSKRRRAQLPIDPRARASGRHRADEAGLSAESRGRAVD